MPREETLLKSFYKFLFDELTRNKNLARLTFKGDILTIFMYCSSMVWMVWAEKKTADGF
jgi:hypothetical protein